MQENTYTPRYGPNFPCARCFWNGPPQFKYVTGMLRNLLPLHVVTNIACYAYRSCAIQDCKYDIFDSENEYECDFCEESWAGWKCYYCGSQKSNVKIR